MWKFRKLAIVERSVRKGKKLEREKGGFYSTYSNIFTAADGIASFQKNWTNQEASENRWHIEQKTDRWNESKEHRKSKNVRQEQSTGARND